MPRRELSQPIQVVTWLESWGDILTEPCEMILIGSGGLLWHVHRLGLNTPLPENSMDVDPITSDEALAILCYDAIIGSDFEKTHGWHVNLMPDMVLDHLPNDWRKRSHDATYGRLKVVVPSVRDLFVPKLKRGEPRDRHQYQYAQNLGLIDATD